MLSNRDPKMVNTTLKLLILIFLILKPHCQLKSKGVLILTPNILPVYPGKNQKPLQFQKEETYVWIIPSLSALFSILQASRISKQETLWGENKDEISSQPFVVMQFSTCLKFIRAICPKHVPGLYNLTSYSNQFFSISTDDTQRADLSVE